MNHLRLRQIEELFHEALDCDPEDRDVFLAAACGADPELLATVESLLVFGRDRSRLRAFVDHAVVDLVASLKALELQLSADTTEP